MVSITNVHHAQLVEGTKAQVGAVCDFLERAGFPYTGNPDVWIREYVRFGVEDARALSSLVSSKPVEHARRVFVIAAALITPEAQNALLKTLEEPGANALLILIVPQSEQLLPTLRSRMERLSLGDVEESTREAQKFLQAGATERLVQITALLKKDGDERDLHTLAAFLNALEVSLAADVQKKGVSEGLHALYSAKRVISDQSVAMKPLLEYMALSLPKV